MMPQSVRREGDYLHLTWEDGHPSVFEIQYLRRKCPCVMCKAETERTPDGGIDLPSFKTGPALHFLKIEPVGNYALQIQFSDGHSTGIYSYEHLRKICACPSCQPKKSSCWGGACGCAGA